MKIALPLVALGVLALACTPGEAGNDEAPAAAVDPVLVNPEPGEVRFAQIRQLTFGGNNAEAYFSASGDRLIFQRQESLDAGCDQQYLMNIDGSGMRRVSNGMGRTTCGYFIDDDTRIVYSSTFEHDAACPARPDFSRGYVWPLGHFEIYSSSEEGEDLVKLTDNGAYNAESTLSPDGSTIIFTSTMDGDLDLYTMKPDGSDLRRITDRFGYDGGAFFSPDGSKIVWRAMYPETAADSADYAALLEERLVRPSSLEIWMANADGSEAHKVTDLGHANFAPFFHPNGERIIFSSNHATGDRTFNLYMVDLDGGNLEQITHYQDFDGFPVFSPDGKKLVWASNRNAQQRGETNIFIADWIE